MDLRSAAVFDRADHYIEIARDAMELLREFPDHQQAPAWRKELAEAKQKKPSVYAMARLLSIEKHVARDVLRVHPEDCPRCHGVGSFRYGARTILCGCPLAEARERGKSLLEDAIDRGIEDRPPDPAEGTQLALL